MYWHSLGIDETAKMLGTDKKLGLSDLQAEKSRQKHGGNVIIEETKPKGFLSRFFEQLRDFMVVVLITAAVVSFLVSIKNGEGSFYEPIIIIAIIVVNAIIGVIQQEKAENALNSIKKLSAPTARVIRNGKIKEIPSEDVVVGDLITFDAGSYIPADGRIIEANGLKTEESSLTGESFPAEKNTDIIRKKELSTGDIKNMVFASTFVSAGNGTAIVTETGKNTEVGKIAGLLKNDDETETPLKKRLGKTGKHLSAAILVFCGIIFILGILRHRDPFDMFMTSISLSVAAIPEGLPAIITVVLAIGTQRMSAKNTIIRKLPAVETLGSADIICSDKTGTLTQNKMTVIEVQDICGKELSTEKSSEILKYMALCSNSSYSSGKITGEPTENAIVEAAFKSECEKLEFDKKHPRILEIPFSSETKYMITVNKAGGKYVAIIKGAPEIVMEKCGFVFRNKNTQPISPLDLSRLESINSTMAKKALRVIAAGFREFDAPPNKNALVKCADFTFLGFAGLQDPPRPEAERSVHMCKNAGIIPVMITGDHKLTAQAIAEKIGIFSVGDKIITGEELNRLSEKEFEENVEKYRVFARVSPQHKVKIVKALQKKNHIVAMTGDGVNDAPALKAADIGCAMGLNGTDTAKNASDIILMDDNFATIVEAIKEGRCIFSNIRKTVHFLLSSNIGEVLTIFAAMLFGWVTPLLPIQLLWVNLVTDSLPAIALGLEPPEENIMSRPPEKNSKDLFGNGMGLRIFGEGIMIGVLALAAFGIGHIFFDISESYVTGRTMAFAVLSISQLFHAYNMRSEKSLFRIKILSNRHLNTAFITGLILQIAVITVPYLNKVFGICSLDIYQWLIVFIFSFAPIPAVEAEKLFTGKTSKIKINA